MRLIRRAVPVLPAILLAVLFLAPALPAAAQMNPNPMTGTWLYRSQTEELVLVLNQDGTYSTRMTTAEGVEQYSGAWRFNGTHMTFVSQGEPPEQYLAGMRDQNTLVITFSATQDPNAATLYLVRVDGPQTQAMPGHQNQPMNQPGVQPGQQAPMHPSSKHQGQTQPGQTHPGPRPNQAALGALPRTLVFHPYQDTTERAFTVLVPQGWYARGGIVRVDPGAAGGPANSIEAKVDFSVHSDQQSTVAAYVLPSYYYTTLAGAPAQSMYPEGSAYFGMEVLHLMDPVEFAVSKAFPYAHPGVSQPRVTVQRDLPELVNLYRASGGGVASANFSYKAAMVELQYQEGGVNYQERMLVVIEDRGLLVAGQWSNLLTLAVRAPAGQLDAWEPVFRTISDSFVFEQEWLHKEIRGQITNAGVVADVQAEVQRIDAEITAHRQKTNAMINEQMYMNLTGQANYVDPDTNQIVQGSNAWDYRLKAPDGSVVYTNNPEEAQNYQNQQDYKLTPEHKPAPITY